MKIKKSVLLSPIMLSAVLAIAMPVYAQTPELKVMATTTARNWNGIAVSNGNRLFVNFPRFDHAAGNPSLVEIRNGKQVPFPGNAWNAWQPGKNPAAAFVSPNALYINRSDDHLWAVDPGDPFGKGNVPGAPKLVEIDLTSNKVANVFLFNEQFAPQGSHLNDIRIDGNWVFITDSGTGALLCWTGKPSASVGCWLIPK